MNEQLQLVGTSDPAFQHVPVGFRTLFNQVWGEHWRLWQEAGAPKPAPKPLMKAIDQVTRDAWQSDLGVLLERHNQYLPAEMVSLLSSYQHHHGMLSTADLIPTL
jgi:hypothetical protein